MHERANTMRHRQRLPGRVRRRVRRRRDHGCWGRRRIAPRRRRRPHVLTQTTISGSTSVHDVALASTSLSGVTIGVDRSRRQHRLAAADRRCRRSSTPTRSARVALSIPSTRVTRSGAGQDRRQLVARRRGDLDPGLPVHVRRSATSALEHDRATATCASAVRRTCATLTVLPSTIPRRGARRCTSIATLSLDLTITPQALATVRTASVAGAPVGTAESRRCGESTVTDPLAVVCSAGAGERSVVRAGRTVGDAGRERRWLPCRSRWAPRSTTRTTRPPSPNSLIYLPPVATPSFPFATRRHARIAMSGHGRTFDLGAVQADDSPITAVAGGPYAGVEGSPITFDGSGVHVRLRQRRVSLDLLRRRERGRRAADAHVRRQRHATAARSR